MDLTVTRHGSLTMVAGLPKTFDYTVCPDFQRLLAPQIENAPKALVFDLSGINSNYQRLPWEIRELSETLPAKWMVPTADLFEHTKTIGCNGSGSKPSKKPEKPGMGI